MTYGLRITDADGKDLNTGFVRVLVVGWVQLALDQFSGSWSFNVPDGYVLDYLWQPTPSATTSHRRNFNISGNVFSISQADDNHYSANSDQSYNGNVLLYLRKA